MKIKAREVFTAENELLQNRIFIVFSLYEKSGIFTLITRETPSRSP